MSPAATLALALSAWAPFTPFAAGPGAPAPPAVTTPSAGGAPAATSAHPVTRRWAWPIGTAGPPAVLRGFDPPQARWNAGHRGVDLAAGPGESVRAVDDGIVAFAGVVGGRPVVSIDHPGGLRSTLEPVVASVRAGQAVRRGDVVGRIAPGPAHCAAGPCVHLGAVVGSGHDRTYVDPMTLLGGVHPVLLPWSPS